MRIPFVFVVLLDTAAYAIAETASTAISSTSSVATHTVAVGAVGHAFTPDTITANVNDVVEFRFYPLNHSVARAGYKYPCIPYEYTGVNKIGFWSGFAPVNVVFQDPPKFDIVINDTDPIFFYCSAPGSCLQERMIGVINPNGSQTLGAQLTYVDNSTFAFSPGEGYPAETTTPSASPTILPTPHATVKALSSGVIAGIVVGVLVFIASVGVIYLLYKRKKQRQSQNASKHPPSYSSPLSIQQYPDLSMSPPITDHMSPEWYLHSRSLNPLSSPHPSEIPLAAAQNSMFSQSALQDIGSAPFSNHHSPNDPQELAASESTEIDGRKLSRPFSFHDPLLEDRDKMAKM